MPNASAPFSEQHFWQKLTDFAVYAGREVVEKALMLFYAAQRPETPLWAKTVIYSALAYFILPADMVPDFIPMAGYADDLTTLATALGAVALCITPEVQTAAKQTVKTWFGDLEHSSATHPQPSDAFREISID